MATTKKSAKKAPAKNAAGKTAAKQPRSPSGATIEVRLTKAQVAAAEQCVATSGKVRLSIKEITKSKLPKVITAKDVVVD